MTGDAKSDLAHRLTMPERQALKLIAEGCSTRDIARVMQVALEDAATIEQKALEKIGARGRAEAVRFVLTTLRES